MHSKAHLALRVNAVLALLFSAWAIAEEAGVEFGYFKSSQFWNSVSELRSKDKDPVASLDKSFERQEKRPFEDAAFARFAFKSRPYEDSFFNHSKFGMGAEGLAGGEVYNRISPKIRGYLVWIGGSSFNVYKKTPVGESGLDAELGTFIGAGQQKLIQGPVSDFLEAAPIRKSTIFVSTFDLGLGYTKQFSAYQRGRTYGLLLPLFVSSEFEEQNYDYKVEKQDHRLRWRIENEYSFSLSPAGRAGIEFGAQSFLGPQPTPVRILPRIWDSIHDLKINPNFGSIVGLGPVFRAFSSSRRYSFESYGGYYGGYLGYGARLNLASCFIEGGSFGFEQSSGYRIRESRLIYGILGIAYAW